MAKVGGIILLVVGLGVALYFFNSPAASKIGSVITPPSSLSSSTASTSAAASSQNSFFSFLSGIFNPKPMVGPGDLEAQPGGESPIPVQSAPTTSDIAAGDIPAGFTLAELSPYFHMIRLNGVGTSLIALTAPGRGNGSTTIDITGWDIKTKRSGEFIPQAVNVYDPSAAPVLSDIVLTTKQNDVVYMYSTSAPSNLRLNECMGFLNETSQFNPGLPSSCPSVDRAAITNFSGQCQNYILSLGCQAPNMSSPQIPRNDYQCQEYLQNNFTYKSCISNHATDQGFLSNEWHIWMGSSPLDQYHDNIELLDQNGLVVDTYSY